MQNNSYGWNRYKTACFSLNVIYIRKVGHVMQIEPELFSIVLIISIFLFHLQWHKCELAGEVFFFN